MSLWRRADTYSHGRAAWDGCDDCVG
jgi:hypothetical protein